MFRKKSVVHIALTGALAFTAANTMADVVPNESVIRLFQEESTLKGNSNGLYIVQLKGNAGISKALELQELTPSNRVTTALGNRYNPQTPALAAYTYTMKERQRKLANEIGDVEILHFYTHTFNGFSAQLTPNQMKALKKHPDVVGVYEDQVFQNDTANTPLFLGLTEASGQHTRNIKGENVVVGILDGGIWPENPSFSDDGSYTDPFTELGWKGKCDAGVEEETGTFSCNNKLIGARYFSSSFQARFPLQFELGELLSPRDVDGHGSHVASTAAGNEGVDAFIDDTFIGRVSGIAPRARIAAYKVCWNSDYISPTGIEEHGCFFGDSMAAIDQAVEDGVDVLNYSIGNSVSINSPVYNSALLATQAGVFIAASAGNSRIIPNSVSNIAPWMTTVAASSYDGISVVVRDALDVTVNGEDKTPLRSIEGDITAPIPDGGISGTLVIADPVLACEPLSNNDQIANNIVLMMRGSCTFNTKIINAQLAGAKAVVVYTDDREFTAMGGSATGVNIPGAMIRNNDGISLSELVSSGSMVQVNLTTKGIIDEQTEIGNVMADFSSRGFNRQTQDILKPDITAPGVNILAATSEDKLDIRGNTDGERFQYLGGTSMSSPHVAGLGALLISENPTWSPAQIKSALMTTARQNLVKEDNITAADPFDFGSGHVDPLRAADPGLTYDANVGDYLGFLCGQDEGRLVLSLSDTRCDELVDLGFPTDPSQLNYPTIAIGALGVTKTITRTVTDVTGLGGEYNIVVEAPEEIKVSVSTFDESGNETDSPTLVVTPNGKASYSLTFTKKRGFSPGIWRFGSVVLESATHSVYSSIVVRPIEDPKVDAPDMITMQLRGGRANFNVRMGYTGASSIEYSGLVPARFETGTMPNSNGSAFNFERAIADGNVKLFNLPVGTRVLRFSLSESALSSKSNEVPADSDVDLFVYSCLAFTCSLVGRSESVGSNEEVILKNPEPRSGENGDFYLVAPHLLNATGVDDLDYSLSFWIANDAIDATTRITAPTRAIEGRFNNVRISTRNLERGVPHVGAVTFYDEQGTEQATTVVEVIH